MGDKATRLRITKPNSLWEEEKKSSKLGDNWVFPYINQNKTHSFKMEPLNSMELYLKSIITPNRGKQNSYKKIKKTTTQRGCKAHDRSKHSGRGQRQTRSIDEDTGGQVETIRNQGHDSGRRRLRDDRCIVDNSSIHAWSVQTSVYQLGFNQYSIF